ncbi:MAG: DAK2 domain-containing protein [Anaerolineae bacterium]
MGRSEHAPVGSVTGVKKMDGIGLLEALQAGSVWLQRHIDAINALNVFPVPDGDTGTNMSLTIKAALAEVGDERLTHIGQMAGIVAHGALMGARGNSGVILSQILRGMARALENQTEMDSSLLAKALSEGTSTAYKGVMKPVEGTILTVAREAAAAAERQAAAGGSLRQVLAAAYEEAEASLLRTPDLLPVLAEAGVVDAGGTGYARILEGWLRYMDGESVGTAQLNGEAVEHVATFEGGYNYDTQFLIKGSGLDVDEIRAAMATFGDSVVVAGDESLVKVHVHCDLPGQALDYAVKLGDVTDVVIENMELQYREFMAKQEAKNHTPSLPSVPTAQAPDGIAVIAVASGDGLQRVFESLGVAVVIEGGQTMNPSTQEILEAIERVPSEDVIVLPNNSNIILAAQQAKELAAKRVAVVPTRTLPQGISALLAYNYQTDLDSNVAFMTEACDHVATAEITRSVRNVQVNGLSIEEGQVIGLVDDDLVTAGSSAKEVLPALLERMDVANAEIITVYYGEDVTEAQAQALAEQVRERCQNAEIEILRGGQAHYWYIISAE